MDNIRFVFITRSRQFSSLAMWLIILVAVIYFKIGDLLLTISLGGYIPGSSIELSPLTAMCISAAGILATGTWLLIKVRTTQTRSRRYKLNRQSIERRSATHFERVVALMDGRESAARRQYMQFGPAIRHAIADGVLLAGAVLFRGMMAFGLLIAQASMLVMSAFVSIGRLTRLTGLQSTRTVSQLGRGLWHVIDPMLLAADRWLELQFRAGEAWTAGKLVHYEQVRIMKTVVDDWTGRPAGAGDRSRG